MGVTRLIKMIELHNLNHPEDCDEIGKWTYNLPKQNDIMEYINEDGTVAYYRIGAAITNLKQGKLKTTPELFEKVAKIMVIEGKSVYNKKTTSQPNSQMVSSSGVRGPQLANLTKLVIVIKQCNALHPENCDKNGRWIRNFPVTHEQVYLKNRDGRIVKYNLGKKMYDVSRSSLIEQPGEEIKELVYWEVYQQMKLGPKTKRTKKQMQTPPLVLEVDDEIFKLFDSRNNTEKESLCAENKSVSKLVVKKGIGISAPEVSKLLAVIKLRNILHPEDCDENGKWIRNFPVVQEQIWLKNRDGEVVKYNLGKKMYMTGFSSIVYLENEEVNKLVSWKDYQKGKLGPKAKRTKKQMQTPPQVLAVDDKTFKLFTASDETNNNSLYNEAKNVSKGVSAVMLMLQTLNDDEIDKIRKCLCPTCEKSCLVIPRDALKADKNSNKTINRSE